MDKEQFKSIWEHTCWHTALKGGSMLSDLNQFESHIIIKCANIVSDEITGDLTSTEEHLLIKILTAIRDIKE